MALSCSTPGDTQLPRLANLDVDLWRHYWFGMVNRGVMAQPYWQDEQWTMSVQHTEADIDKHIAAFDDIAISLAKAQQERAGKTPALAAH